MLRRGPRFRRHLRRRFSAPLGKGITEYLSGHEFCGVKLGRQTGDIVVAYHFGIVRLRMARKSRKPKELAFQKRFRGERCA